MQDMFQIEGTTLTIFLPEDLDHPISDTIRYEVERLERKIYIRTIIFDFGRTDFMDSSGIGLLMGRYRALGMRKDSVRAVHVSRHIDRLLHLSGLHRYIMIERAEEEEES